MKHQFKRNKYHVSPKTERSVDGIVFDSKKEAERYKELLYLRKFGAVVQFLRQTPFHLPGNSRYIADFLVFWKDGHVTVEDVKGVRTETYKLKKRQVEELYAPITITEL